MEDNYIVYVKTGSSGVITAVNSSAFLPDTEGWTQIDEGAGDRYHHAQGNNFENGLIDENGCFNYNLVVGVVTERTAAEKEADLIPIRNASRIAELKVLLAGTDYAVIKIAEGVATAEEYADVIAQRQAWRAELNSLGV